jgi:hypothetical protein
MRYVLPICGLFHHLWGLTMKQIEYTKKPSIVTIRADIKKALLNGEQWIQLIWGENQITLERGAYITWVGYGWIGKHGGQDLADEITRQQIKK